MYWFSTTLLNTCDVEGVGYDELVALHRHCSVKLQQICLQTWYYSNKRTSWSIGNQREKLLDWCPSIRHANLHYETLSAKTASLSIQHTCRVESCYVTAAATYMPAGLVLLSQTPLLIQTCLLVEYCCKIDACWTVATQSACLLTFCHSILHVCWRCAFLSAIPAGTVSHNQPCLLIWCLTISRVCWYSVS